MDERKLIYETVFVLHPELPEEDVEAGIQQVVKLLEDRGSETMRIDRGGKRRLAYPIRKQRYGYYNLIHYRAAPDVPAELERTFRLNERVMRHLTIRFDKEEQLTGFTRLAEDDGRDDDRDDRRRGGRRDEYSRSSRRGRDEAPPRPEPVAASDAESAGAPEPEAEAASETASAPEASAERAVEETG